MTCVYVNPTLDQFWIIDYRIYAPESDGKSKLDHVHDMLTNCVYQKHLQFGTVLMDSWYATKDAILTIEQLGKTYYCPSKTIAKLMTLGVRHPINGWILWRGLKLHVTMAN